MSQILICGRSQTGDIKNENNGRGINLLDVTLKIVTIILHRRIQPLKPKQGTLFQFGATKETVCPDSIFSCKPNLYAK